MSKYKVGDKVVLTVTGTGESEYYSYYVLNDNFNLWEPSTDNHAEPLSTYTEPLERKNENKQKQIDKLVDKLHRQAAEITRLLAENKKLKAENGNVIWEIEQAFDRGCNAAWELARKIVKQCYGYEPWEAKEIFGTDYFSDIFQNTYPEAAKKVAEWERQKEEIKVGDVVSREGFYGVVKSVSDDWLNGITASGVNFQWLKCKCTKTGRHIDIDSFLKQIGGEGDEK